jgi:hypothetical protein
MKRLLFGSVLISTLFIVSCQKEIDWGFPRPGVTVSQLLVKMKSKTGTDTTQVDYTYDANKKLIREKTAGMSAGNNLDNDLIIKRNSSGIIDSAIQKAATLVAAGIDSIVTRFKYNTATSKYTSSTFQLNIPGFTVVDSTVYTYDGAGRISKDEHWLQATGLPIPIPPILTARNTYTYSSDWSNLLGVATDAAIPPATTLSPATSEVYTVDGKINPLIMLNEAVLLSRVGLYNANNPTKAIVTNTIDPTQDFTMDYTYKYNSSNKPDSSYGTRTPGGAVTATKYYYQ